ncbi:tetratricopeptide repeat protein [Bifidobacterium callitrichos]|uniref:Helicase n=1 Tax=Bifidobacterium callitrichos DSM 23973 TaxID=1437609 RepID=A0A086ZXP7_9BIFI|nr:helicase [Bifidobacterium callitrichos]KFI51297.1 helicase [Bifidobacterium callitrichos DSM 23973]
MAEGNERSGKSFGGRKGGYGHGGSGSGRPSGRGGKGFKPRGNGGKSFGGSRGGYGKSGGRDGGEGGFHKGGFRKDFHKSGGFRKDGDRDFRREDRQGAGEGEERREFHKGPRQDGGFHKEGGFRKGPRRDGDRGGFRRDGGKGGFRKDGDRDFRRDDRREGAGEGGERREFHKGPRKEGGFRKDGGFRKGPRRDNGNPRYQRDDRRDDRGNRDQQNAERRSFTDEEKREYREHKRTEYMSRPRRNSDGTMSFPSQNPYTDRRPNEPKMPKGLVWAMLSKDERERLRGLSKEHAENIGLHILAAYTLIEDDPEAALEHAQWAAKQASRIDFARETLAFIAYRKGDYKLALREFRTAYRMNGFTDYLPFIADCERGLGNPKKAIEIVSSDDAKMLRGESKAEMFLVYAGALADLKLWDKAIEIVHTLGRSKGLPGAYRMRALQAEQLFLEEAGRNDEAIDLDQVIEKLEDQYADFDEDEESDDVVIDHDLEHLEDPEILEKLGITEEDAEYAPEDESEDDANHGDESAESVDGESADEDETQAPAEEAVDGAESDDEPESDETEKVEEHAEAESSETAEPAESTEQTEA